MLKITTTFVALILLAVQSTFVAAEPQPGPFGDEIELVRKIVAKERITHKPI